MRVSELLRSKGGDAITLAPDTSLGDAARLFLERKIGGAPVVGRDGELMGFVAEREFVIAVDRTNASIRRKSIDHVMRTPAPVCSADDTLQDVMTRMTHQRLRHLVVVDGGRVAGVISVGDIVKHRLDELETEAGVLRDYVAAQRAVR
jgi:CBS domain-containing protein